MTVPLQAIVVNLFRPKKEGEICCCQNFNWGKECTDCFGVGMVGGYTLVGPAHITERAFSNLLQMRVSPPSPVLVGDIFLWKDKIQQVRGSYLEVFPSSTYRLDTEALYFKLDGQAETVLKELLTG